LAETFEASRLDWDELRRPPHQELFAWYQRIIALRASDRYPLQLPVQVGYDAEAGWLWFVRGDLCVAVNFAAQPAMVPVPQGNWDLLLSSASDVSSAATLAAYEARIYRRHG
jgi:maltooligosyltrehalose trehalohydrolase